MRCRIILDHEKRDASRLHAAHRAFVRDHGPRVTYRGAHGIQGFKFEGEGPALGRFLGSLGAGWFRVKWE